MVRTYFTLFLVFLTTHCFAQSVISGTVVDEETNLGIGGVSVYFNNTTFGSTTDSNGAFSFSSPISGNVALVFSHVNYVKVIQEVNAGTNQKISVRLKKKDNTLNEVVIRMPVKPTKEEKSKWLKIFTLNLIGMYGRGYEICLIKNPEVLVFSYDKDTKNLSVGASEALVIENLFLGYTIKLDLEDFSYNFLSNEVSFRYSSLFENLKRNKLSELQIIKNRMTAYLGSSMYFMRALYSNNLVSKGFHLYQYRTIANTEKKRVNANVLKMMALKYEVEKNPNLALNKLFEPDTATYYASVLSQSDSKSFSAIELSALELTAKDKLTRTVNFNFSDTLRIEYHVDSIAISKKLDLSYDVYNEPGIVKIANDGVPPLTTYIYLFQKGGVNISNNGYYPDFSLFMYGDMAERRLANALPYDFEPSPH